MSDARHESAIGAIEVSGEISEPEVAAIIAAIEAVWPRPVQAASGLHPPTSTLWRYSGRWWSEGRLPPRWR